MCLVCVTEKYFIRAIRLPLFYFFEVKNADSGTAKSGVQTGNRRQADRKERTSRT